MAKTSRQTQKPHNFKPDIILTFVVPDEPTPSMCAPATEGNEGDDDTAKASLLPFLYTVMADKPKRTVKNYLKHNQVRVNNHVTSQFDYQLMPGDKVEINTSREWQVFSHPRIKIIYEDDDIIVINKGYGLLSMASDRERETTAYAILKDYVKRVDPRSKLFIVHRLDQHTSGLMMFAKTVQAKETMQHNWNNMVLDRRYAAVVEGIPDPAEGTIDTLLSENSRHVVYVPKEGTPDAQRAVTRYKTVKTRGRYALMDVTLDTGRKNQIRVHLKHIGTPIVGDRKYGATTSPIHRLALHARTLRFVHPTTRRDMNFTIPLPASFSKLV